MRLRLVVIFLFVNFFQRVQAQYSSQFRQGDSIVAGMGCSMGFYKNYTFKPKGIRSYHQIAGDYGKDNFQAYYRGQPLPQLDPAKAVTTTVKEKVGDNNKFYEGETLLTDGDNVYYGNTLDLLSADF